MDPRVARILQQELDKRTKLSRSQVNLLENSFPQQAAFVSDPAKRKVACLDRRGGKSWATSMMLINSALQYPGTTQAFLSYNRQKARTTIEKPLRHFLSKHNIGYTLNKSINTVTLENGSTILLRGVDKFEEIEKLRGEGYPLAIIDECQRPNLTPYLQYIVDEILEPCVAQYDGTIVLTGTVGDIADGLFYDIVGPNPKETGWSVHKWSWQDNITVGDNNLRICDAVRTMLSRRIERDPLWVQSDGYRREWCSEWVIDDALVYKYNQFINTTQAPPAQPYYHILGCDPAASDGTAFVVVGYSPNDPHLYVFESIKHKDLNYHEITQIASAYKSKYNIISYVIDGASKLGVNELLRQRHDIPWKPTPKAPNYKYDAIKTINSDFQTGKIKIVPSENQNLIDELKKLTWDTKIPTRENQNQPNDLCDALLYAYLDSKHYASSPIQPTPQTSDRYRMFIPPESDLSILDYFDIPSETNDY